MTHIVIDGFEIDCPCGGIGIVEMGIFDTSCKVVCNKCANIVMSNNFRSLLKAWYIISPKMINEKKEDKEQSKSTVSCRNCMDRIAENGELKQRNEILINTVRELRGKLGDIERIIALKDRLTFQHVKKHGL